ncbi:MAG: hypothetical protein U9Q79_11305, partial [Candidatus Hydrogenedentes bacterium]|nr:hypothetical protein [Candidatus Hydrogenedentota bacterium]
HLEPVGVILARAQALHCPVRLLHRDFDFELQGTPWEQVFSYRSETLGVGPVPLGLSGDYQGANAAVAVALAESLMQKYPQLEQNAITQGLKMAQWPCRLERVLDNPPVIIDVAHNPAGMRQLVRQIPRCVALLAVSSDKKAAQMIRSLSAVAEPLILTQFKGHRALPIEQLSAAAGDIPHQRVDRLEEAITAGMRAASAERPLVITGSIYTAGQARTFLVDTYNAPPLVF